MVSVIMWATASIIVMSVAALAVMFIISLIDFCDIHKEDDK